MSTVNADPAGLAAGQGSQAGQGPQIQDPSTSPPLDQQQPQHPLPQQQHPAPPQHPASPVPPLQSNSDGAYRCQWTGCTEFHPSPEQLYDHVCDKHIGRKSTNNLNLQCSWANCHVQVVKRDHITSHIRVHVPLKPHRCQFCGKTFKRPQDLKKHVKTHADDSMINGMNQPSSSDNRHPHQNGGYNMGNQHKGPGYYPDPHQMPQAPYAPPMGYQHQGHGGAPSYYGPSQQQQGPGHGYGTVSYAVGQGGNPSFDSGKSMASLSSFIGDVQRGVVDTKNYAQVTSRLAPLQNNGVQYLLSGGGLGEYQPAAAQTQIEAQGSVYAPTASYPGHPLDNLRTKDQLIDVARHFERMASTVYEMADQTDNQIAAAGTGQPGAQYVHSNINYRHSLSPPGPHLQSAHEVAIAASSQQSNDGSTPVLSTPSSTSGYTSGHSPESNPRLSPATPSTAMYPTLPGPSAAGYPPSSMAATATLGTQHQNDYRPRHGGGYLQKAQPMRPQRQEDEMDTSEDHSATPKNASSPRAPVAQMRPNGNFSNSNIDPALSGEEVSSSTPAGDVEEARAKTSPPVDSDWVDSIRTLDALRKYVTTRLENGDYENDGSEAKQEETETPGLYPALGSIQVGA